MSKSVAPLLEAVTISSPNDVLGIVHNVWQGMIIKTLVELHIPDFLMRGPQTVGELASDTGTQAELLFRFLRCAASCQYIREISPLPPAFQDARFGASEFTPILCTDQAGFDILSHLLAPYTLSAWTNLGQTLRSGVRSMDTVLGGQDLWTYLAHDKEADRRFNRALTALSALGDPLIAASYDFSRFASIVDIGGGQGSLLTLILKAHPTVQGIIFDRIQVHPEAVQHIKAVELDTRLRFVSGDFFEEIPVQADAYLIKNVLHDWDDEHVSHILRNIHDTAPLGAHLLIVELVMDEITPPFDVTGLDINMLFETGGKQRREDEFAVLLQKAGFLLKHVWPVGPSPYKIIESQVI
jgi:O-methyltransferase domain